MGDLREEDVMDYMSIRNIVMQMINDLPVAQVKRVDDLFVGAVHSAQGPPEVTPSLPSEIRDFGVRVLHQCHKVQPCSKDEIRHAVELHDSAQSVLRGAGAEQAHHPHDRQGTDGHARPLLRFEEGVPRPEVAPAEPVVVPRGQQVHGPQQQHEERESHELQGGRQRVQGLRPEGPPRVVPVDVIVVLMMVAVGDPPAVVRHQERRVGDVAHDLVDPRVFGERAMPTIMPHHKEAPPVESHNIPPHELPSEAELKEVWLEMVQQCNDGEIPEAVKRAPSQALLKALLWNSLHEVVHGEWDILNFLREGPITAHGGSAASLVIRKRLVFHINNCNT
mmetsp:Transcript_63805/g.105326  ORF Transcript_63805/g.105326 Transcript_63805/m.105326 type:complete len:335 (+) Transcript_63805:1648-2652(+)